MPRHVIYWPERGVHFKGFSLVCFLLLLSLQQGHFSQRDLTWKFVKEERKETHSDWQRRDCYILPQNPLFSYPWLTARTPMAWLNFVWKWQYSAYMSQSSLRGLFISPPQLFFLSLRFVLGIRLRRILEDCVGWRWTCVSYNCVVHLAPNFTPDKYHPLCWRYLEIEGKEVGNTIQLDALINQLLRRGVHRFFPCSRAF